MPAFVPLRSVQEVVLPAVCPSPHRLRAARYELRRCSGALDYQKAVAVRIAEVEHGWHATSEPHDLQIQRRRRGLEGLPPRRVAHISLLASSSVLSPANAKRPRPDYRPGR